MARTTGPKKGRKTKPTRAYRIDLILPGLGIGEGRSKDRFLASSETKEWDEYRERVAMVKDLARRLFWDVLRARMENPPRFSTTEMHNAYRQGDDALKGLLERAEAHPLEAYLDLYARHLTGEIDHVQPVINQVRRFISWLAERTHGAPSTRDFTKVNVNDFLKELKKRQKGARGEGTGTVPKRRRKKLPFGVRDLGEKVSDATRNRYRAALSGFATYLVSEGRMTLHPVRYKAVKKRPERSRMPRPLSADEYTKYIAAIENYRPGFGLVAQVLIHSGADVGELIRTPPRVGAPEPERLLVEHCILDTDAPALSLMRSKTDTKAENVPIPRHIGAALSERIERHGLKRSDEVFFDVTYKPFQAAHKLARKEIDRPSLRIKDLRHFAAISWAKSGIDITAISKWLRHATLNQTMIYADYEPDKGQFRQEIEGAFQQVAQPAPASDAEKASDVVAEKVAEVAA